MPPPSDPLDACVAAAQAGNPVAAERLVEHLYPLVLRIVHAHRPRRMGEDDLVQEVFMKLLSRLGDYRPMAGIPIDHWAARLAVRTCLDHLRSERRRPELRWSDLSERSQAWLEYLRADAAQPSAPSAGEAKEVVDALLDRLPAADRLVLTLLDLEGHPVAEIAKLTGWSASLVKVRAFRARHRLRALVGARPSEDS